MEESRKYQRHSISLGVYTKRKSHSPNCWEGAGLFKVLGRRAHHRTKLCGRVGNPGKRVASCRAPTVIWEFPQPSPQGKGPGQGQKSSPNDHTSRPPGPGRFPSFPSIHVSWKRSHFPTLHLTHAWIEAHLGHRSMLTTWLPDLLKISRCLSQPRNLYTSTPPKLFCTALK